MPVQFLKQLRVGLCGAACAQMVLHSDGLMGTRPSDQEDLWEEIKARTTGATVNVVFDPSPCKPFPGKICDKCGVAVSCWCTHPKALRDTILAHAPGTGVKVITRTDEDNANRVIEACLNQGASPIVNVLGNHWVVVEGFDRTALLPVSILDPNPLHGQIGMTIGDWNEEYMVADTCGKFKDKYVVVSR